MLTIEGISGAVFILLFFSYNTFLLLTSPVIALYGNEHHIFSRTASSLIESSVNSLFWGKARAGMLFMGMKNKIF